MDADKPLKIEIPSRAMAFSAARNLGLSVGGVNGNIVELVIKTTVTTQLKLDPGGRPFVTIQFGGQWRDVYIKLPRKRRG